ncbi:MAG: SgcJ/EcaC family oxidoreductase [Arenibacterium sp.]
MTAPRDDTAIRKQMDTYLAAYAAQDSDGCAAIYTTEALVITPWGPPATGRDAIAAEHKAWFEEGETNKTLAIVDLRIDGDLATCLMAFSADVPAESGGTEGSRGASLNTLIRHDDGTWQIAVQMLLGLDTPLTENPS